MVHVDTASGTVVLNAATVPRVVPLPHSNGKQVVHTGVVQVVDWAEPHCRNTPALFNSLSILSVQQTGLETVKGSVQQHLITTTVKLEHCQVGAAVPRQLEGAAQQCRTPVVFVWVVSAGPAAASRHHFLVVELQGGVPCCAADVWVQTAEHAAADANPSNSSQGSSSGSILDPAVLSQQRNFLAAAASAMHGVQHSKAKSKTTKHAAAKANQEEAVRRVQLQAPQQLQLWREQHAVDGYQVHIAEVYEVLRSIDTDSSTADTAGDAARSGSSSCRVLCWQYFDAHAGKWVVAAVASTQRQPAVQH